MSTIRFESLDDHGRPTGELPVILQGDVKVQYASTCTCALTDESTWTRYGSAIEPGSQWEPDPECPEHQLMSTELAWSYTSKFDFTEVHPQAIYTIFEVWPRGVRVPKWLRKHAKRRKLADPALKRYTIGQIARGLID
jgi:hypothetical protein